MKMNALWKTLTRTQKAAWSTWAKSNTMLLPDGSRRLVSGRKAFTIVQSNRAIAGDAAAITTVPAAVTWLDGALSASGAGALTAGAGSMTLIATGALAAATKWFIWATPPMAEALTDAHARLRFIKCLSVGVLNSGALTPEFKTEYRAACGSFNGTGESGAWGHVENEGTEDEEWVDDVTCIYYRVHHYANGQLSPGVMLKDAIKVEL